MGHRILPSQSIYRMERMVESFCETTFGKRLCKGWTVRVYPSLHLPQPTPCFLTFRSLHSSPPRTTQDEVQTESSQSHGPVQAPKMVSLKEKNRSLWPRVWSVTRDCPYDVGPRDLSRTRPEPRTASVQSAGASPELNRPLKKAGPSMRNSKGRRTRFMQSTVGESYRLHREKVPHRLLVTQKLIRTEQPGDGLDSFHVGDRPSRRHDCNEYTKERFEAISRALGGLIVLHVAFGS